jgi:hypothetical protein
MQEHELGKKDKAIAFPGGALALRFHARPAALLAAIAEAGFPLLALSDLAQGERVESLGDGCNAGARAGGGTIRSSLDDNQALRKNECPQRTQSGVDCRFRPSPVYAGYIY